MYLNIKLRVNLIFKSVTQLIRVRLQKLEYQHEEYVK